MNMRKKFSNYMDKYLFVIVSLILSVLAQAIAYKWFIKPSKLAAPGLGGVALGISYIFERLHIPFQFGQINISFNIPLILLSWKMLNKEFAIFSALNIFLAGLLTDAIPVYSFTDDLLANSIVGAIIVAFAAVVALRAGISTGGTDIIGVLMSKKGFGSVGSYVIYLTFLAFALTYYTSDFKTIVYSALAAFIMTVLVDKFYEQSSKVTMLIVSSKAKMINKVLQAKIQRGSTLWKAEGGYTKEDKNIILMTISSDQKPLLKNVTKKVDQKAFIISLNTESTIGEWTSRLGQRKYSRKEYDISDFEQKSE